VLAILNLGALSFSGLLFGKYPCTIGFTEDTQKFAATIPEGDGIVYLIDHQSRRLYKYGFHEYLTKRDLGQLP
jgi:hypothetical protein